MGSRSQEHSQLETGRELFPCQMGKGMHRWETRMEEILYPKGKDQFE
jgi:hypothetical protein